LPDIKLGEPKLGDSASEWEEDANFAMNEVLEFINNEGPLILNRTLFTNKVPTEDRVQDFLQGKDDPSWFQPMLESQLAGLRPEAQGTLEGGWAAFAEVAKMEREMMKKVNNGNAIS
jgi:hypothetical protein